VTSNSHKPMTKKQIRDVVTEYATRFPEWTMFTDGMAFTRNLGPIQQMIWFQGLRTGAYRPMHVINTTALSTPRMLTQMLDVRNREATLKQHAVRMPPMLAAMEHQFRPDIRKPLDIAEVLELCEAEARPDSTNDLAMLAILYAWLGRDTNALECCEQMQHCSLPTLAPIPEWEDAMRAFGRDLAKAVEAGMAREFLGAAALNAKAT